MLKYRRFFKEVFIVHSDWQKIYFGLGSFRGLEPQPTENKITILHRMVPSDPMKAIRLKAEGLDLYYAYLEASHDTAREKI
jgi:hypothetical protein